MIIKLNFPTGQFTHSELAAFNGKTNQQVWIAYQQAIKDGVIVFIGLRAGKGKPSKLYQVAGPGVVAVTDTTKVIQTAPLTPPKPTPKPVKVIEPKAIKPTPATVKSEPIKTVSAIDTAILVRAATFEPDFDLDDTTTHTAPKSNNPSRKVDPNYRTLVNMFCPICKKACIAWDDETGVMVQCNQPINICKVNENPYGHSRTEKGAFEILCQKYRLNRKVD